MRCTLLVSVLAIVSFGCVAGRVVTDERVDAGAPRDAGPGRDAGPRQDAGPRPDAGPPRDAGPLPDSGPEVDAGPPEVDAGVEPIPCIDILEAGWTVERMGGINTGDPLYDRPNAAVCPAEEARQARYDLYLLCAPTVARTLRIELNANDDNGSGLANPYLVVYDAVVIPGDTLQCREGNDDSGPENWSLIDGLTVAAGEQVLVVASGFSQTTFGDYRIRFSSL